MVASRQGIEQAARVSHFLLDILFRVGIVRLFEVPVGVNDLVSLDGVFDRSHLGLGRTGGKGCVAGPNQGDRADQKEHTESKQTQTSHHRHLTSVSDLEPSHRLAEPEGRKGRFRAQVRVSVILGLAPRHPALPQGNEKCHSSTGRVHQVPNRWRLCYDFDDNQCARRTGVCGHSSVAQWQSIRLLTGGL